MREPCQIWIHILLEPTKNYKFTQPNQNTKHLGTIWDILNPIFHACLLSNPQYGDVNGALTQLSIMPIMALLHYKNITSAPWCGKSPATSLFIQPCQNFALLGLCEAIGDCPDIVTRKTFPCLGTSSIDSYQEQKDFFLMNLLLKLSPAFSKFPSNYKFGGKLDILHKIRTLWSKMIWNNLIFTSLKKRNFPWNFDYKLITNSLVKWFFMWRQLD